MPHHCGQILKSSTSEKPAPAIWASKARRISLLALRMRAGVESASRARKAGPSRLASSSQTRMGCPASDALRPRGVVVVR